MKRFSKLNESCVTSDVNQGNALSLGVSNHYTPVQNIVTNIRNLFSMIIPVVASVAASNSPKIFFFFMFSPFPFQALN